MESGDSAVNGIKIDRDRCENNGTYIKMDLTLDGSHLGMPTILFLLQERTIIAPRLQTNAGFIVTYGRTHFWDTAPLSSAYRKN